MPRLFRILFLIIVIYIFCSSNAFASTYTKYSITPLLEPSLNQWDSQRVNYPYVLYDNGLFKMWYTGFNGSLYSLGYATSLDGINWLKYPNNPILTWDGKITSAKGYKQPTVIKDENIYKMWFESVNTPENVDQIGYATSSSGIDWNLFSYKVLSPSKTGWDRGGLAHPSVVKENSKYKMWYAGVSSGKSWQIGYADSFDEISWVSSPSAIIIKDSSWEYEENGGIMVKQNNGVYSIWYNTNHFPPGSIMQSNICYATSSSGLTWTKVASQNPVITVDRTGAFDQYGITGASAYTLGNTTFLWYGGIKRVGSVEQHSIGLAYQGPRPTSIPTPTPTIIPPTPTPRDPIIVVPGIMASWNKEALLEGQENPTTPWKLLSFIKEYDGLVKTLENLGYTKGTDLFVWPYDWRKSIDTIALQLHTFITSTIQSSDPDRKIHIIGHSLGGLVARTLAQKGSHTSDILKLITVGTPHKGTVQPYGLWEAGNIETDNVALSLAGRFIIELNRQSFGNTRSIVQQVFPVLKDLLPTEPYLQSSQTNQFIPKTSMSVWNDWLSSSNQTVSSIYPMFDAVSGTGSATPHTYTVASPNWFDQQLGNWKDGKPIATHTIDGDGTVPGTRSVFSDDPSFVLPLTHGDLIADKVAIDKILNLLSISHTDSQIEPGKETVFQPSLLLFLRSPATMSIHYQGNTISDENGVIFIPEVQNGTYPITVTGTATGTYRLGVLQRTPSRDYWKEYTANTTENAAATYQLTISTTQPLEDPIPVRPPTDRFSELEIQLKALEPITERLFYKKAVLDLSIARKAYEQKKYSMLKFSLESFMADLSLLRITRPSSLPVINITIQIGESCISTYHALLFDKNFMTDRTVTTFGKFVINLEKVVENKLKKKSKRNDLTEIYAERFSMAQQYHMRGDETPMSEKMKKYILYLQSNLLLWEIR